MKKIQSLLIIISFAVMFSACNGQVKPLGKAPLKLLDFNFDTKVATLYPDEYKSKQYKGYYDLPVDGETRMIKTDTTFNSEYSEDKKAIGIEFRQVSSSSGDVLALAGEQAFSAINIASALDGTIKAIGAEVGEITPKEAKKLIDMMNGKYGKYKKLEGEFMERFNIYEWESKDKIYRYASIFTDESNQLKIEVDQDKGKIQAGEMKSHDEGYFFLINKSYIKDLETLHTGAFVYIK